MSVSLLKSVRFERLDAGLLLTEGVPDEKDTTAVRFIGRLYVQHTSKNNAVCHAFQNNVWTCEGGCIWISPVESFGDYFR